MAGPQSKILYVDPFSGIAGDMFLGALLDLGLDLGRLQQELAKLKLAGCRVSAQRVERGGISATKFNVEDEHAAGGPAGPQHQAASRTWAEIKALIERAELSAAAKSRSLSVFTKLAEAEGKIHNRPPEQVFSMRSARWTASWTSWAPASGWNCSALTNSGADPWRPVPALVKCAHGLLPVPAPATAELLRGLPRPRIRLSRRS